MVHWLATDGGVDGIWKLVGLQGPLDPRDSPGSVLGSGVSHVVLDDGFGMFKALVQCFFTKMPAAEDLESVRDRASKVRLLSHSQFVKWNVYTLGKSANECQPDWSIVTIDDMIKTIEESSARSNPVAQAYSRYLARLVQVRDLLGGLGIKNSSELSRDLYEELRNSGTLKVFELAIHVTSRSR